MSRGDRQLGVPIPEMEAVENPSAEALLDSLKTISATERRKHATVFNYWHSIRANRQFPPIRDLDPLEISDAGPFSILLEMIGGGEDAVVRHFGQSIKGGIDVEKIGEAPSPSLLSCIHAKLPIVAACREAFAFEDSFEADGGSARCWVTLLPFSANGTWIDFVYGYVSLEAPIDTALADPQSEEEGATKTEDEARAVTEAEPAEAEDEDQPVGEAEAEAEDEDQPVGEAEAEAEDEALTVEEAQAAAEDVPEPFKVELGPLDQDPEEAEAAPVEVEAEPAAEIEAELAADFDPQPEPEPEPQPEPEPEPEPETDADGAGRPSFTAKFMEGLASVGGFYGKVAQSGPALPSDAFVEELAEAAGEDAAETTLPEPIETVADPAYPVEGTLQTKLSDVRALAEEARQAQLRSNAALYEGLSAAYDFALDAESAPEEYLRLVEAQGLKIQLRSPMKPVVRLAFDGFCDEPTIPQLEAVLAWALKNDLPRGSLAERIEAEGGIGRILDAKAA
jgi:hypothetical protein